MSAAWRRVRRIVQVMGLLFCVAPSAVARTPSPAVTFDVAALIECRDVTPVEFSRLYPREKLVEARIQISTLVYGPEAQDLTELFYRLDSPERSFRIADYFPRTTLTSDYAGNLGIEEKNEQASNLGLNLAGSYGPLSASNATVSTGDKDAYSKRYELLPPLETMIASGTLDREYGVYFKLRPTPRTSVEGAQELAIMLRVPAAWRADYVRLQCQAFGKSRQLPFAAQEIHLRGQGNFLVGLYLSGDEAAQGVAAAFVQAESRLRSLAVAKREEIERRAVPTPVHELAIHLSVKQPRIPDTWLDQVLVGRDRESAKFLGYLPDPVRDSAMDYFAVRRQLRSVNAAGIRLPKMDATVRR